MSNTIGDKNINSALATISSGRSRGSPHQPEGSHHAILGPGEHLNASYPLISPSGRILFTVIEGHLCVVRLADQGPELLWSSDNAGSDHPIIQGSVMPEGRLVGISEDRIIRWASGPEYVQGAFLELQDSGSLAVWNPDRTKRLWTARQNLWAVAAEMRHPSGWRPLEVCYTHAPDQAHARTEYLRGLAAVDRRRTRIVACGRVIGYHVEDRDGKMLSV